MRYSTIQNMVAGGLAVAWLIVLSWPVVTRIRKASLSASSFFTAVDSPRPWESWCGQSVYARRKQVMFALLFSVVASFLLAIAFRGEFVFVHGLMDVLLVGYGAIAVHVGRKSLNQQRRQVVDAEVSKTYTNPFWVPMPEDIFQDDPLAGDQWGSVDNWDTHRANVSMELEELDVSAALGEAANSSSLLDEATKPAVSALPAAKAEGADETLPVTRSKPAVTSKKPAAKPVFTVAPKDESASRSKARPVYIEAQLDEEFEPLPAANDF